MKHLFVVLSLLLGLTSVAAEPVSKKELVKAVLVELGVAERFDRYLTRGADQATGGEIANAKYHRWMQDLWIKELGWQTVEDAYAAHFDARFSEKELTELLSLAKNPVVRKLFNEELAAFRATFDQRNKLFARFWYRFNSLEFVPPEDLLR